MSVTRIAAVQMASGPKVDANLSSASRLLAEAQAGGARLAVLPEFFALMGMHDTDQVAARETPGKGPIQDFLATEARRRKLWLCAGAVPLAGDAPGHVRAAYLLYDARGRQVARYDKMHLFDVTVPGEAGEQYRESAFIEPGDAVSVTDTPFGRIGLAGCYDLRFPELFRAMLPHGVEVIVVPSAFTAMTGRAHWETLLRARAIENLCYVVAAAQGGFHISGRETWGHSMIIDPWGTVLERRRKGTGVLLHDLDIERLRSLRRVFPTISHTKIATTTT